jgi:hypothetical protein
MSSLPKKLDFWPKNPGVWDRVGRFMRGKWMKTCKDAKRQKKKELNSASHFGF